MGCHHEKVTQMTLLGSTWLGTQEKFTLEGSRRLLIFSPGRVTRPRTWSLSWRVACPKLQIGKTQLLLVAQRRVKAQIVALILGLQKIPIQGPWLERVTLKSYFGRIGYHQLQIGGPLSPLFLNLKAAR